MNSLRKGQNSNLTEKSWRWLDYLTIFLYGLFILLAIRYQIKLLNYVEFGDESETIVAAKMIAAGSSLYSQIFNHHGPLTFLPGILLEKIGGFGIIGHRILIVILQIIALLSIYFSPLLNGNFIKNLYVIVAASIMLLYLPEIFGHMYMYQVLAGLLLIIILAQYTLPSIVSSSQLSTRTVVIGNILIASLPFLAITYTPISVLLFFASLRKNLVSKSSISFIAGIVANIIFLITIGSISGFFAFHIYLNLKVLPLYNTGSQSALNLILLAFNSATSSIGQFSIFLILFGGISFLTRFEKTFPWRSIFIGLGIGSLLIRGINFHALPYFYSLLALPLIFFNKKTILPQHYQLITLILISICITKLSLLIPGDRQKLQAKKIPISTEFSQFAQFFTEKNDRIIAYSFQNFQYIAADRLPASGYYFYLPWQEKYNENPKFGISINACKEITEYQPKIMLIDKWKVWDSFTWESYGSCIQKLLDKNYVQWPERPYYIRKDLVTDDMDIALKGSARKRQPSPPLNPSNPIPISMTLAHQAQNNALKRIGIMFGTYDRPHVGVAQLRLSGSDGSQWSQQFSLTNIANNQYHYFDLDSKRYTVGQIVSLSGGGVSTWESHGENTDTHTCITYVYADGKRHFTPGCPLF
jgi:hypothetical protein